MILDVCAHAPSKEVARAFMAAAGIAEERDGVLVPLVDAWIDEIGPITKTPATFDELGNELTPAVVVSGWHVNVRYYGAAAEALTQGLEQFDSDGIERDLFERTRILDLIDARTGSPMSWSQNVAPFPPGYANSDGVRVYSPDLIATPSRVWA